MNVDSDIAPLLEKMDEAMKTIRGTLVPMLGKLEEDTLVSYYSLEEQARLSLSAAFAMAFSLYSLDKLQNKQHAHVANVVGQSVSPTTDAQLVLKIERITDYIKKLREITQLHQQQQQSHENTASTSSSAAETSAKPGAKRSAQPHEEPDGPRKTSKKEEVDTTGSNLGDAEMFSVVSRVPGETGTLVSRLIHQTKAANKVSTGTV